MSIKTEIILIISAIVLVTIGLFVAYKVHESSATLAAIQAQVIAQKQLVDGLVQSSNQYTTKDDLNKFIQNNAGDLKAIQDSLNSLGASIAAANEVTANSSGQDTGNIPSSSNGPTNPNPPTPVSVNCPNGGTVNCPNTDPFNYQHTTQNLALNEDFANLKVPIGTVGFSAWQQNPWNIDIQPRQYNVTSVIGTDENEKISVVNKFTVKVGDKSYNIPISTAQTEQVVPTAKFSWWNPHIFATGGGGVNFSSLPIGGSANAGLTLGIMSYGKFKTNPDLSILQIGAAYQTGTQKVSAVLNPINVNVGNLMNTTIIDNTYLGPSIQLDTGGNIISGLNLSIGF